MNFKLKHFLKHIVFFIFVFVILCQLKMFSLDIPNKPNSYVNDYANLLLTSTVEKLNGDLKAYESETSNQIVIVTFKSLEGESLEDFSIRLAEKWKVGQKDKNNGVILLIFKDDRKIRMEVGYGLESNLTDAICSEIINEVMVPNFKNGNFDLGVTNAVEEIKNVIKGLYTSKNPILIKDKSHFAFLILFFLFAAPIIGYILIFALCISLFGIPLGIYIGIGIVAFLFILQSFLFKNFFGTSISSGGGFLNDSFLGGGFGGGFSGGGGSFGGGGSSGSW